MFVKKLLNASFCFFLFVCAEAKNPTFYASWGYNRDWFTTSNLHISNGGNNNFTIHHIVAKDRPNFEAIKSYEFTIPQYNYRIGYWLPKHKGWAIEYNFDHTKYVMNNNETRKITGTLNGNAIDKDTLIGMNLLQFEHTNGANFAMINVVKKMATYRFTKTQSLSGLLKVGIGTVIPKTDVTLFGQRLDNIFHIAGYMAGVEASIRYYPIAKIFIEPSYKLSYSNYTNVLVIPGFTANHAFGTAQAIVSIGVEL